MSASMTFLWLIISGAVLFFAAGYLLRLLMHTEKGPSKKVLNEEIERLLNRLSGAEEQVNTLTSELTEVKETSAEQVREIEALKEENTRLSDEKREASAALEEQQKSATQDEHLKEEISELKQEIAEAKKRAGRSKVSLDISKEEVRKLKREIETLKKSKRDEKDSEKKLEEMAEKLEAAEAKVATITKLEKENRYLRKEVKLLSDQSARTSKGAGKATTIQLRKSFDAEMKEIVQDLLEMDQVHSVVVADSEGVLVGGVGDSTVFDGLAELCGRVGNVGKDIEKALPLSGLRTAHLKDQKDGVAAFRTFRKENEVYVLGTIGSNSPPGEGILELTVADLSDDL